MKLGIIGVGNININFAIKASQLGYEVLVFDTDEINNLKEIVQKIGANTKILDLNNASMADFIVFSVKWENLESILSRLPNMAEKIILHTNNPIFNLESPLSLPVVLEKSSFKKIAMFLPEAHIIKVFNKLQPSISNKNKYYCKNDYFYLAEDERIKKKVAYFFDALNLVSNTITTINENESFY